MHGSSHSSGSKTYALSRPSSSCSKVSMSGNRLSTVHLPQLFLKQHFPPRLPVQLLKIAAGMRQQGGRQLT